MKQLYTLMLCLFAGASALLAQDFTYDVKAMPPIGSGGVTTIGNSISYSPYVMRLAPAPGGEQAVDKLKEAKALVAQRYPYRTSSDNVNRSNAAAPIIGSNFAGPTSSLGIPLDTHLAVSDSGQVITVANFEVAVYDTAGNRLARENLQTFFLPERPISTVFDPKVHYDPETDRFVIIALAFTSTRSHVYMAFSQTNDATGDWYTYTLEGDPYQTGSFFDYPMASISHQEIFLTGNSVIRGEPWQTGFVETLLYQIDKRKGFAGDSLTFYVWTNLSMLGTSLRNLCPVKGATGNYGPNHYFLSNRNFAVTNDTIIMIQVYDTFSTSLPFIDMQILESSQVYGAPPSARQAGTDVLATNDARILDAFIFNDRIQFVGNTVNPANGFPGVYYGIVDSVSVNPQVSGSILSNDSLEFGYPGIAYTGSGNLTANEQDAVIFCDYSEEGQFPGTGAFYVDTNGELSDFSIAKTGNNFINVLNSSSERWGDYVGCQRKYNSPGEVWTMGTFGVSLLGLGRANPQVTQWFSPGLTTSREPVQPKVDISLYPNPSSDRVQLDFQVDFGEMVEITLRDLQGRELERFFSYPSGRGGEHRFSFDTAPLQQGVYLLSVAVEGKTVASKRLVKQ